jgi:drug/metabolite transporter (DMT)-like permease
MAMMSEPRWSAIYLLLGTGSLLGATFPLGKLAAQDGVPPTAWAWAIAAGASALLYAYALARSRRVPLTPHHLRYYAVTAVLSFVAPNLLIFAAIPRLGAGLTSVMLTLSPIVTLFFSLVMGLRRPEWMGVLGIATGLVGALTIVMWRGEVTHPTHPAWIAGALLIPVFLAAGNVYRTLDWPERADPLALAIGSNLAAAALLSLAVLGAEGASGFGQLAQSPGLAAAQILASAGMFALFFRLQAVGGPVYLSQIGYVAAAVGLGSGTLLLGEHYPAATWVGALIVAAGIALVTYAQARPTDGSGAPSISPRKS